MTRRPHCSLTFCAQLLMAVLCVMNCNAQDTSQQNIIASIDGKYTISFADIQQYVYDSHLIYKYRKNKTKAYSKAVEKTIEDAFTKYHGEEITKATRNHLKKKYSVIVYRDVLNQQLQSIGVSPQ